MLSFIPVTYISKALRCSSQSVEILRSVIRASRIEVPFKIGLVEGMGAEKKMGTVFQSQPTLAYWGRGVNACFSQLGLQGSGRSCACSENEFWCINYELDKRSLLYLTWKSLKV